LARLVELPVVREIALRHDAQHSPAIDHHRAVEQLSLEPERRPHQQDRREAPALLDQPCQRGLDAAEQRVLLVQVLVAVGRDPELREQRHGRAQIRCAAGKCEGMLHVVGGIGHPDEGEAHSGANEAMRIGRVEGSVHYRLSNA
jgi:hypothetical protein